MAAAVEQNLQQSDDTGLVDFDAGITNRADSNGERDALQQREVHVNVEPLGLATRESVRDGLKPLAHGVQVVEAFLQAEIRLFEQISLRKKVENFSYCWRKAFFQ